MFQFLEHTGDIRVSVSAPDLHGVYNDSVLALMTALDATLSDDEKRVEQSLTVESADMTCLLVDFLNEVLWTAVTEKESYDEVEIVSISETSLSAIVRGRTVERFGDEVKAVTYHEAELRREEDRWHTNLVLDV